MVAPLTKTGGARERSRIVREVEEDHEFGLGHVK